MVQVKKARWRGFRRKRSDAEGCIRVSVKGGK